METRVKDMVNEALENEIYDLMDEITTEQLEQCVGSLAYRIHASKNNPAQSATAQLGRYSVKVHNSVHGSWVSISNTEGTAVSRSLAGIMRAHGTLELEEVAELISMINEAWYTLNN